jgi:extracellular elastinolytic metalloproteinase
MTDLTFGMGAWASNSKGIRKYEYTKNMTVNPETYKVLDGFAYYGVHAIGEVWATMLWEITELLVEKHGFSKSLFPPPQETTLADLKNGKSLTKDEAEFWYVDKKTGLKVPKHGNTLMVQLLVGFLLFFI